MVCAITERPPPWVGDPNIRYPASLALTDSQEDDGQAASRRRLAWMLLAALAIVCSLAIETVPLQPVRPRVLYWPPGPDVLPVVTADGAGLLARATVNPPGVDQVAMLDGLAARPRWVSAFRLPVAPRRQLSVVGEQTVVVRPQTVTFLHRERGHTLREVRLPDTSDGFCVAASGDGIWVRLLSGGGVAVTRDGRLVTGAKPPDCHDPLRPRGDGGIMVSHDRRGVDVEGPGWRWRGVSDGPPGRWPVGAWQGVDDRVYVGTLTAAGPGIEVLDGAGRHLRRIPVASGGRVPRFTVFGDRLIVPNGRRWDLYSVEGGRKSGQHPDLSR